MSLRRSLTRLQPAKIKKSGFQNDSAGTGMKSSEEDKLFMLMEHYAYGSNYLTKKLPRQQSDSLQRASRLYDRIKENTAAASAALEDAADRSQQRALRSLPEVLKASASRPCSDTWPITFRKPTMTPPVIEYTPLSVENLPMFEVPQEMVNVMHTGIEEGKSSLGAEHVVNEDASPADLATEEASEEERMRYLRESYLWWRGQQQYGPVAETVQRDFMRMKHEQEIKLYTIRRAKHGENDYSKKRQFILAPVLRDDTKEGVMYKRVK